MHRPIQSSKTMAIDINDLTGACKVRTASWEKEVRERWYECESDESGTPQKIEHRVEQFLTYYGTDIQALLEGCEALEYILTLSGDEWLYYSADIGDNYYHYVERVIIDLTEAIEREAEGVSELVEPLALKRYRDKIEEQESYIYIIDKQIQAQQERITELEALTASPTARPEEEQPAPSELQALQARITELEDENEELRANQRQQKKGKQQCGTLGLKACQRIGAFAILLELLTGKEVGVFQADGTQNKLLKTLYSEVTNTGIDTTTTYMSRLQNSDHRITDATRDKIRTELTRLLQALGIALKE